MRGLDVAEHHLAVHVVKHRWVGLVDGGILGFSPEVARGCAPELVEVVEERPLEAFEVVVERSGVWDMSRWSHLTLALSRVLVR